MLEKTVIGLALGSLFFATGGPLLARFAGLPAMAAFGFFALGGLLGLAAMATGAAAALEHKAYFTAMIGMVGCLPFIALTAGVIEATRYPSINDITTDLANPPAFLEAGKLPGNAGRDMGFPAEFAGPIREHYPEATPLHLPEPPDQVYRRALGIAGTRAFRWAITAENPEVFRFEAVASTRVFRWKDDLVLRIQPDGDGGSIVDMRSKSREGKGDLGANARRIRKFFEALQG